MPERNLRLFLALSVAVVVAVVAVALATRAREVPPATGAAQLVPGDALVYVHLSTDTSRSAVRQALSVAERFPDFPLAAAAVSSRLGPILTGTRGVTIDFGSQVKPWLGREVGFALLNSPTSTAGSLIVIGVRSRARATAFVDGAGALPAGEYRGISLLRYPSGTTVAFVRHYLVLGQRASVRAAVDAAAGRVRSLAANPQYRQAAGGDPADRVLDAYASVAGVRRVLEPQGGLLGALGVLLYEPALTGSAISVSATSGGLRVRVDDALDPTLAGLHRGAASFTPSLASALPEGTTLLLDVTGLGRVAGRVLTAGAEGGIAGRVGPLLRRLGAALASEGVDVSQITGLFRGETAVAVSPASAGGGGRGAHGPALVIVARTKHQAATRELLAGLEGPLARLFPPPSSGSGQVPEFNNVPLAGITAHQLSLAAGLELDYAVFRGLVVISTSLQAIAGVVRHAHSLADNPAYRAVTQAGSNRVTSLVFLDFNQLLSLAEQTGLTNSSRIAALAPDLKRIRAIGLASTRGENDTTAELSLQIP